MLYRSLNKLFRTDGNNYSLLFLRIIAAIVILPHGAQKLLGWFGGYGYHGTIAGFANYLGIPPFLGFLDILAETIGALFLIFGLLTRVSSFGLTVVMVVAVLTTHIHNGFFMNWSGTAAGEGFEYHILYLAISLVLMVKGGGAFALDTLVSKKIENVNKKYYEFSGAH